MKRSSVAKRLEQYLENEVCFRDYDIVDRRHFASSTYPLSRKCAVHQCVDGVSLEHDVDNALYNFHRDGFGCVVFYVWGAR